jgi:hypothetical protein
MGGLVFGTFGVGWPKKFFYGVFGGLMLWCKFGETSRFLSNFLQSIDFVRSAKSWISKYLVNSRLSFPLIRILHLLRSFFPKTNVDQQKKFIFQIFIEPKGLIGP